MSDWKTRITKVQVVKRSTEANEASLVLIYPPGPNMGKRFSLPGETILGRGADCSIQIDRESVSRRHARVFRDENMWVVEDLVSTNGSYVNDISVTKSVLRDGDFLKIGAVIFKFLSGTGIEASYHEEIYRMTILDALTGAHNKRYFLEFLEREIARCARYHRSLSLIIFDIDHFKALNDKHGHITGDYILREISRRVLARVRREELLARYSGEKFAVVLPESDLASACAFGEQVRRLVGEQSFEYEGDVFPVTISIGVACSDGQDHDVAHFVKIADDNLYRAKREGRNRVVAGAEKWNQWKVDPAFRSHVANSVAIAALCLLARDQILASARGAAHVDDLEGLLYSRLHEQLKPGQRLWFGALEGGGKLLIAMESRNQINSLRAALFEALRRCAEEHPDARFAVGPIQLAKSDATSIEDSVAKLDAEVGLLDNGYYLPQPVAVALGTLDGTTTARAKAVLDLGETLLQWISLCAVAELSIDGSSNQTISVLRRNLTGNVTIERWLDVLTQSIDDILNSPTVHELAWRVCLGDKQTRDEVFAWLHAFVQMGNEFAQVGASRDEQAARHLVDEAAPRLRHLLKRELRAVLALVPAEVELVGFDGDLQSYRMTRLIGDRVSAPVAMYSRKRMNPGLWLCDAIADRHVALEPFFVRETCPRCGARELFLLNRLDELEFRNPATGHVLRKPVDDLLFSPQARERLMELTTAASSGDPAMPGSATTGNSAFRMPACSDTALRERQHMSGPEDIHWQSHAASVDTICLSPRRAQQPRNDRLPTHVSEKHTILFLAANPASIDRFVLDREARAIQVELERSGFRDRFELVTRWAVEPVDLLRELRKLRPTILHFSGHGHRDMEERSRDASDESGPCEAPQAHGLYFQGTDGRPQFVQTSAITETFGAAGASVKLVVLSACYSDVQAEALLAHIDCVVGMARSIRDDAARNFAIGFYGGLAERESVATAFKQGRAAVSLEGLRDGEIPQLRVRTGVDASQVILAAEP